MKRNGGGANANVRKHANGSNARGRGKNASENGAGKTRHSARDAGLSSFSIADDVAGRQNRFVVARFGVFVGKAFFMAHRSPERGADKRGTD